MGGEPGSQGRFRIVGQWLLCTTYQIASIDLLPGNLRIYERERINQSSKTSFWGVAGPIILAQKTLSVLWLEGGWFKLGDLS